MGSHRFTHALTARIFEEVAARLGEHRLLMREGTLIAATPTCTRPKRATSGISG